MTNKKLNGIGYFRFSSSNQHETSIEAQEAAVRKYAEEHDIEIVRCYYDRAISGKNTKKREGFKKMLKECEEGDYDIVLVHKYDRFARNLSDTMRYVAQLEDFGMKLVSVTQPDPGGNYSKLYKLLQWALDEFYSDNLSTEVMKGLNVLADKCQHTGGKPPLGYDVDPVTRKLVINESEAEAVRLIYKLYLEGCGYDKIAKELNDKGYRTKEGKTFCKNSFYDLLRNMKYCGCYVFNRTSSKNRKGKRNNHKNKEESQIICNPNGVPAIISKETYNKAMEKMNANKHKQGAYKAKRNYLLSGLIRCGVCGRAMQGSERKGGKSGNITASYRCCHNKSLCSNKEIQQEVIENYVLGSIERYIFDERNIPAILKGVTDFYTEANYHNLEEVRRIDNTISGQEKRLNNIKRAIMNGFMDEDFKDEITELKESITRLTAEKNALPLAKEPPKITEEMLRSVINTFSARVRARDREDCKLFIRDFVDCVTVYKDKVEVDLKLSSELDDFNIHHAISRQFLPSVIVKE